MMLKSDNSGEEVGIVVQEGAEVSAGKIEEQGKGKKVRCWTY